MLIKIFKKNFTKISIYDLSIPFLTINTCFRFKGFLYKLCHIYFKKAFQTFLVK